VAALDSSAFSNIVHPSCRLAASSLLVGSLSAKTAGEQYEENKPALFQSAEIESLATASDKRRDEVAARKRMLAAAASLLCESLSGLEDEARFLPLLHGVAFSSSRAHDGRLAEATSVAKGEDLVPLTLFDCLLRGCPRRERGLGSPDIRGLELGRNPLVWGGDARHDSHAAERRPIERSLACEVT